MHRVFSRLDEPFQTMVVIAMCLGLRVSEILALQWSDFDFKSATLMITPGTVHGRMGRVQLVSRPRNSLHIHCRHPEPVGREFGQT